MNFLRNKILFRCDAATIAEIGTGHMFRCLTIAEYLKKKYKLKNKDIAFLIRSTGKYKIGLKILQKHKYKIIQIKDRNFKLNSERENYYINKHTSNLLIIDRLGKISKNFVKKIKSKILKIIIDDSSNNRKLFDLSLNPLTPRVKKQKNNSYVGFKYLILPVFFYKFKEKVKLQKNIFISFGGYDHKNLTFIILEILNKLNLKFNIYISKFFEKSYDYSKFKSKIYFFDQNQYFDALKKSKISITAGGLSLFDNIFLKKKIICIPQYEHQYKNAKIIARKKAINLLSSNSKNFDVKFKKIFLNLYNEKLSEDKKLNKIHDRIINMKKIKHTLLLIGKTYERSIN